MWFLKLCPLIFIQSPFYIDGPFCNFPKKCKCVWADNPPIVRKSYISSVAYLHLLILWGLTPPPPPPPTKEKWSSSSSSSVFLFHFEGLIIIINKIKPLSLSAYPPEIDTSPSLYIHLHVYIHLFLPLYLGFLNLYQFRFAYQTLLPLFLQDSIRWTENFDCKT